MEGVTPPWAGRAGWGANFYPRWLGAAQGPAGRQALESREWVGRRRARPSTGDLVHTSGNLGNSGQGRNGADTGNGRRQGDGSAKAGQGDPRTLGLNGIEQLPTELKVLHAFSILQMLRSGFLNHLAP